MFLLLTRYHYWLDNIIHFALDQIEDPDVISEDRRVTSATFADCSTDTQSIFCLMHLLFVLRVSIASS